MHQFGVHVRDSLVQEHFAELNIGSVLRPTGLQDAALLLEDMQKKLQKVGL